MKQKLRLLSTLLLLAVASMAWADSTVTIDFENNALPTGWVNTNEMIVVSNPVSNTSSTNGLYCLSTNGKASNSLTSGYIENIVSISVDATRTSNNTTNEVYIDFCPNTSFGSSDTQTQSVTVNKNSWSTSTLTLSSKASGYVRIRRSGGSSTATKFIDNIVITCESGGNQTVAKPSISGDESFVTSTQVSISCSTEGAAILYSTDGNTWSNYDAPFTLTATTTVQAKATKSGMTESEVASKTFTKVTALANIGALTAETSAGTYYVTLNNAVVTYVNGNYAYIQDASGAIVMYKSGHGLTAGQVLNGTANVTYQLRNSNPQLTDLSGVTITDGTAPEPTEVAASDWNSTISAELSKYYKITGATITNTNSKYYITLGSETVQLYGQGNANPVSVSDLEATYTVIGFPTIYNTTPELQIFEQPTAETVTRQELSMTFTGGTLEFTDASDFVAPTLSITDQSGTSVSGLTITYESSNPSVANVDDSGNVTIGSEFGSAIITATFAGNDEYVEATASYTIVYSNSIQGNFTWDLSKASYDANPSEDLVTWSSNFATMTNARGSSTSAANNYLGGDSNNRTSSRFYKDNILTITPASSYSISSVVFTATSENYATTLATSTWTNATATASGTTVTVIPVDGASAISAVIGATCGFTGVTVSYIKDERANAGIAFSTESLTITQGKDYTAPTFSNPNNVDVTFATDHAEVASWNNGFVLGTATGTAVITATFEGNDNYMPATATLTVTVKEDLNFVEVTEGCGIYQKVTSASDLEAGKRYLMVYETQDNDLNDVADVFNGVENKIGTYDVMPLNYDLVDNTTGTASHPIVLQSAGSGNWYLMDGDNFLYWSSGNNLYSSNEVPQAGYKWSINFGEDGMSINNVSTPERYLQFNANSPRFACYAGTQNNVVLYKELMEAPIKVTIGETATGADGAYYSSVYYKYKALQVPAKVECQTYKMTDGKLTVSKTYAAGSVIPADEAVVIKASAAGEVNFVVTTTTEQKDANSMLKGCEVATPISEPGFKYYKLTLNATKDAGTAGFYFDKDVTDGSTINAAANKCYLRVPASTEAKGAYVFGDDTDGIRQIENGELTIENAEIYNLSGQRVNKAQKGIYIVNGKKVVIR